MTRRSGDVAVNALPGYPVGRLADEPTGPHRHGHRSDLSRWWSGPERLRPVNRVRAGRQQLSAELARCLRAPGRHLEGPDRPRWATGATGTIGPWPTSRSTVATGHAA